MERKYYLLTEIFRQMLMRVMGVVSSPLSYTCNIDNKTLKPQILVNRLYRTSR